jgi:hypothetical protein
MGLESLSCAEQVTSASKQQILLTGTRNLITRKTERVALLHELQCFRSSQNKVKEIKQMSLLIASPERTINTATSHLKPVITSADFCDAKIHNLWPKMVVATDAR